MENETPEVNVSADNSQPASSVEQTNPAPAAVVPNTPTESSPNAVPATKATTTPVAGQAGQSPVPPMDKNYQELRSWTTRVSQQNADMRKQMEAQTAKIKEMADLITKATEKPYDPDQFMEEFRAKGPEFLKSHLETAWKQKEENYLSQIGQVRQELTALRVTNTVNAMRADTAKYPDFAKLEDDMQKLLDSGVIPEADIQSKSEADLLVQLYQIAKLQHSQEAIKAAEANGRKAAETELAREARTGVAGGGRVVGQVTPDIKTMTSAQMKANASALGWDVE